MALDRNNLVKDGKFNRAEIMKRAWAYVKNPFSTQYRNNFKGALKAAWAEARLVMSESRLEDKDFPMKGLRVVNLYNSVNMRMGYACR